MNNIKQLSPNVADQIAAGEVIERPASVVKELVENSIDADSDRILIEVDNGGKDRIRVKDNGAGIKKEQLELAISRHTTSKIEEINDLYSLKTLGFRGEALSSIASVSEMEITSRPDQDMSGKKIKIKGGEIIEKKITGCPAGTDITVENLFYNTPARFKYMKTTGTEFRHVSDTIYREALCYPEICFILKHDSRQVLSTPGSGKLKDTIHSLYGSELTEKLLPVDFENKYIEVRGFITEPSFYRSSRSHEFFFVNRRSVYSSILSRGVEAAYHGLLPKSTRPATFLYIKLNPILVDVNVHPAKKEVKFSRSQIIKNVIKKGIRNILMKNKPAHKYKSNSKEKEKKQEKDITREQIFTDAQDKYETHNNSKKNYKIHKEQNNEVRENNNGQNSSSDNKITPAETTGKNNLTEPASDETIQPDNTTGEQIESKHGTYGPILGQLHNTYLIVGTRDGMYIIDQHAAHERILYEKLMEKYNKQQVISQPLLTPVKLELTLEEVEIIKHYNSQLQKLGIKLESFGHKTYIIREVPVIIKKRAGKRVINELIDNLLEKGTTLKQGELIEEIIIYMSCRGAVKAGQKLDYREYRELIKNLFNTENPYRCPHGRPTLMELEISELEKELGRT